MSNVLRLALVDPRDDTREKLKSMLIGMDMVWLEAECSRYEFFADVVAQTSPDVGVICMDASPDKPSPSLNACEAHPRLRLLALSENTDGPTILKTLRAGAKEFLTLPVNVEELLAGLHRIQEARYGSGDSRVRACKMIAVAGATGGVGCTSIAVNIGCNLAANRKTQ